MFGMGPTNANHYWYDKLTIPLSASYIRDNHSIKIGADVRRNRFLTQSGGQGNGQLTFLGAYTARNPVIPQTAGGVDTVVTYSSTDSIVYSMSTKTMSLFNKGQINYRQMQLKSEQITATVRSSLIAGKDGMVFATAGGRYCGTTLLEANFSTAWLSTGIFPAVE